MKKTEQGHEIEIGWTPLGRRFREDQVTFE